MMMNWKECGGKRSWTNFKVLSRHSPERTEENHQKLNQDSRSQCGSTWSYEGNLGCNDRGRGLKAVK
jgi:hypothetical protein